MRKQALWIALATLTIGTLDIVVPLAYWRILGFYPFRILQFFLTRLALQAFEDRLVGAYAGMVVHFVIALVIVMVYFAASRRLPLNEYPLLYGIAYGAIVWAVLEFAEVAGPSAPMFASSMFGNICLIGLPTAFFARAAARASRTIS